MDPQFKICLDGVYIWQDGPLITGWEKITKPEDLIGYAGDLLQHTSPEVGLKWQGAKLPMSVMAPVLGTIQKFPNMETGYQLYYNPKKQEWCVRCPRQAGRMSSVVFENDIPMFDGFFLEGTIHTHPNMDAFWSGMDLSSNAKRFGIHMVFGLREGEIRSQKITIFTKIGAYDLQCDEIFDNVNLRAACEPKQEWVDTISEQFKPDFKLVVDDMSYGPTVDYNKRKDKVRPVEEKPKKKEVRRKNAKSNFQKILVEKYGYDKESLSGWLEDTVDCGLGDGEESFLYDQGRDDELWYDGIMASDDVRAFLDGNSSVFRDDYKPSATVAETALAAVLAWKFFGQGWVNKVHAAEDLSEYEKDLKVIFRYLNAETLMMGLEDLRDQVDLAVELQGDLPYGGRLLSVSAFRWADSMLLQDHGNVRFPPDCTLDLDDALAGCADAGGCLSWHALAMLLVSLEWSSITLIHLWEIYCRMVKEGRLSP